MAQHYGEMSPDSIRKSHTSLDQKSRHSSTTALKHTPNHSVTALNHTPNNSIPALNVSNNNSKSALNQTPRHSTENLNNGTSKPPHVNNQPDEFTEQQPTIDGNNVELVQKSNEPLIHNANDEETSA